MADHDDDRDSRREHFSMQRPVAPSGATRWQSVYRHPTPVSRPSWYNQWNRHDRDYRRGREHGFVERRVYERPVYQPVYVQPAVEPNGYGYGYGTGYVAPSYSQNNGWMPLTREASLGGGRQLIQLGNVGAIDTLMLQADDGASTIDSVQVQFADGTSQMFSTPTTLDADNPSLTIDVGHRQVASLVVCGRSSYGASINVLGRD